MKVSELIEQLKDCTQDAEVRTESGEALYQIVHRDRHHTDNAIWLMFEGQHS